MRRTVPPPFFGIAGIVRVRKLGTWWLIDQRFVWAVRMLEAECGGEERSGAVRAVDESLNLGSPPAS
jgi:hypothetical protein